MEMREGERDIAETQFREQRAVDFRELEYEVATEKEETGCKGCLGSAVYMSCFPKGLFFWSMTTQAQNLFEVKLMFISDDLFLGAFWDLIGRSHAYTMAEGLIMGEAGMNVGVLWEDHCLWQLSLSIVHLKKASILEGLK